MKKVERFKCDYCSKLTAKEITMEKHEKQCLKNPNSVNCYRCAFAYMDYDEYSTNHEVPQCTYNEEPIKEDFSLKCHMFQRSDKVCFERTWDEASENLKNYKEKYALEVKK